MKLAQFTMTREEVAEQAERFEGKAETKYDRMMKQTIAHMEKALDRVDSGALVVNIQETLRRGGRDQNGLPALGWAFAKYHGATRYGVLVRPDRSVRFGQWMRYPRDNSEGIARPFSDFINFPADSFTNWSDSNRFGIGVVPVIPPKHRPKSGLDGLLYIWEATWTLITGTRPIPSLDPALLRPIGNGLAEVVEQWDLTPLEAEALRYL